MENTFISRQEKLSEFFKQNIMNIVLFLFCFVYILRGLIFLDESGKTLFEILVDGILAFGASFSIKALLRQKGLNLGFQSDKFVATTNLYGEKIETYIDNYTDELDEYCVIKNEQRLMQKQKRFLLRYGLDYNKFCNNEYDNIQDKRKQKAIRKCRKLKVFQYTSSLITNAYDNSTNEEKILTYTAAKYNAKNLTSSFVMGIIIMFVIGYFSPKLNQLNWANVIWCMFQVIFYILMGEIEKMNAYSYVTENLRGKVKRVISIIDDFTNTRKKKNIELKGEINNEPTKLYE